MGEKGTILDVFPRIKRNSMLRTGLVKLDNGHTIEFSGLFSSSEEKKLSKGSIIEGYVVSNAMRNTRIRS